MGTVLAITNKFPLPKTVIGRVHDFLDDTSMAATCGANVSDIANLNDLSEDLADYWECRFLGYDQGYCYD